MLQDLIAEIDAHQTWRKSIDLPLADSTFGFKAVNDGKLVGRLRAGGDITVSKMVAIREFIARDKAEHVAARQDAA